MFIAIFVVAVVVSAFLDQQERRQRIELLVEYEHLGREMPKFPPKLPMLESLANVVLGCILLLIGSMGVITFIYVIRHAWTVVSKFENVPLETDFYATFIAGGLALMILGVKSVVANLKYRRNVQ